MTWRPGLIANETAKVRWAVVPYLQGAGIDVGCGSEKVLRSAIGIDPSPASKGNVHADARDLGLFGDGVFDYVYSSHCLEHIERASEALAEWWRVLRPGGHLVLYLPHAELYPRRGQPGANPDHKHDFLPEDIVGRMAAVAPDWDLVENEVRAGGIEYSFLQVYRKYARGTGQLRSCDAPRPAKTCIAVRYGGFGDALVAASTFPLLKEQGYHLTVWTSPKGERVLRNDPHIDRLVVHDIAGLGAGDLAECAAYLRSHCDRLVNFSETFEGALLANRIRPNFWWPHEMRHKLMNRPYLELAHDVAGVRQEYRQKYYPTRREIAEALGRRADWPRLIVVAASGSGVAKFWPGVFEFAWRIVKRRPDVHVAVLGELHGASFLEHERLHVLGQTLPVREAYALALTADLVIGQETGLLNAVALEEMPKIVLLSHSSAENLTQFWKSAHALHGDVPCWPCHRLHVDWSGCVQDPETKLAACQAAISPMRAIELAERLLGPQLAQAA